MSDYVEFSKYQAEDREIPRHCGTRTPFHIESDKDYFRATFHSNSLFDGTGFSAQYQFLPAMEIAQVKNVKLSTSAGNFFKMTKIPNFFWIFAIFCSTFKLLQLF